MFRHFAFLVFAVFLVLDCQICGATIRKRQATGNRPIGPPSKDLLPPPALSASFPTLRPRNPPLQQQQRNPPRPQQQSNRPPPQQQQQNSRPPPQQQRNPPPFQQQQRGPPPVQQQRNPPPPPQQQINRPPPQQQQRGPPPVQQQRNPPPPQQQRNPRPVQQQQRSPILNGGDSLPLDLIPPVRPAVQPSAPPTTTEKISLLPPIEIPPEKPIDDPVPVLPEQPQPSIESSFIPTTGIGAGTVANDNSEFTLGPSSPPGSQDIPSNSNQQLSDIQQSVSVEQPASPPSSSVVRFPESDAPRVPTNCPVCECTSEIDYICASNGVIYLNSCSFDCATFCSEGLTKMEPEFCTSPTRKK